MKRYKYLILPVFFIFFVVSCDIVVPPDGSYFYIDDTVSAENNDTQAVVVKKVLMIDFTGIRCTNCPDAHEQIHQLQNIYPGKVIAVAIHATPLSFPFGEYVTDLRTTEGSEIASEFGISSIPIGLVDYFDKNYLTSETAWTDAVADAVIETPLIGVEIQNTYSDADNSLEVLVNLTSLSNFGESLNVFVFLLEDNIITRQATVESPGYIEEYEQLNVFRASVSDVWGDEVFSGGSLTNDTEEKLYSISFNDNWNADNSKIVAFVCDNTNKVLNVNEASVK